MSMTLVEITREAPKLPRTPQLELAGTLLDVDSSYDTAEAEALWEQELLARIRAIDEGLVTGVPFEEVMAASEDLRGHESRFCS